jgi:acyl carrier protein
VQEDGETRRTGVPARWTAGLALELLDTPAAAEPAAPAGTGDDRPGTPTEQRVAGIFGEVLSMPEIGAEDGFFANGGNSLQAMRVVSRINKGFGVKLSVRTLYGNATVRAVSAVVDEKLAARP